MAALNPPAGKLIFIRQLVGAAARSRFRPHQLDLFGRPGAKLGDRAYAKTLRKFQARLLPAGLHLTNARVIWLVHQDATEGVDYSLDRLLPFWQYTSEQDWALCERVQRGVNSSAFRPGPLSHARAWFSTQPTTMLVLQCAVSGGA